MNIAYENEALEDRRFIANSLAGEEESFEALVRKYHKRIISLVCQIIGNRQDAEDIAQEIFMKVFDKLKEYNPKYPFYFWLYRITVNKSYDHLRVKKRNKNKSFTELSKKEIKVINNLLNTQYPNKIISLFDKYEDNKILKKKLLELKPKEKKVIVMRDFENFSYKRIAKILRCSELAARLRVCKARRKLRAKLLRQLEETN